MNLFTRSRYVAVDLELPTDDEAQVEAITRLRRREDELFAGTARLTRHDLGLSEPPVLGYKPFDLANLTAEVAALSQRLMPCILALLPGEGDPHGAELYCPMGIGGHRNHLSTLLAVRRAYDWLRRRCTVFLYEDLHYASDFGVRQVGLQRATQLFAPSRLTPIVMPINADDCERKMRLIRLYASQHASPPRFDKFTPASGLASGLHEIVWQLAPVDA
ncbi:MAG: hypothetical protein ACLQUZ_16490 [Rhizomicrobium sp.]